MINKTIFITTGINGQDGCYLAKNALDNGFEVIGLQRPVPNYRTDQIVYRLKEQGIFDKLKFEVLDLRDKSKLKNLIKKYKPSHFAHLGSQSSVKKSDNYKKLTEESNFQVSKNIIQNLDETSRDTIFSLHRQQLYMKVIKILLLMRIQNLYLKLLMQNQNTKRRN